MALLQQNWAISSDLCCPKDTSELHLILSPPPVSCLALFQTSVLKFYLYYFFIVVMFIILNLDFKNGYELPYVSSTWERKDRLQSSAGT